LFNEQFSKVFLLEGQPSLLNSFYFQDSEFGEWDEYGE